MLNLIKHEFIKSKTPLIISLSIFFLLEICYIIGGLTGIDELFLVSSMMLFMFISFSFLAAIVYSVFIYDMDISQNHKNGYMLFMTPNNSYQIIGAKLIASLIVGIITAVIILAVFMINVNIAENFALLNVEDTFSGIYTSLKMMITGISFGNAFILILNLILQFMTTIVCIYLSKMLCNTIFFNIPAKGVLAFGVFIVINIILGVLSWLLVKVMNINFNAEINLDEAADINSAITMAFGNNGLIISVIVNLIFMAAMYIGTSYLCEKKLSI